MSAPCGTVAGMVTPKGSMSGKGGTLQVSVLPYSCSICPAVSVCLSSLLRSRVRKFRRDLWITLYIGLRIHTRVEFVYEAFQYVMGKAWHHRAEGNYLYLCVWAKLKNILFIFFKRPFCNWTEPNWNARQPRKQLHTVGILWYKDSYFLVQFSSNISCLLLNRVALLWLDENKQPYLAGTARFTERQFF
jgi:hypothetical protein